MKIECLTADNTSSEVLQLLELFDAALAESVFHAQDELRTQTYHLLKNLDKLRFDIMTGSHTQRSVLTALYGIGPVNEALIGLVLAIQNPPVNLMKSRELCHIKRHGAGGNPIRTERYWDLPMLPPVAELPGSGSSRVWKPVVQKVTHKHEIPQVLNFNTSRHFQLVKGQSMVNIGYLAFPPR